MNMSPATLRKSRRWEVIRTAFASIISFLVGGIMVPFFEGKFQHLVPNLDKLVFIATCGLGTIVALTIAFEIYVVNKWSSSMEEISEVVKQDLITLADKIGSVKYVDDPSDDPEMAGVDCSVYDELTKIVASAQMEVLALTLASVGDENFNPAANPGRARYFEALLEMTRTSSQPNFRYSRIFQVPLRRWDEPIEQCIGEMMITHARAATRLARTKPTVRDVTMKKVPTQRLTGFMVIDRKVLVIVVGGLNAKGQPYHKGLFIFERLTDDPLITRYRAYFEHLNGKSDPIR